MYSLMEYGKTCPMSGKYFHLYNPWERHITNFNDLAKHISKHIRREFPPQCLNSRRTIILRERLATVTKLEEYYLSLQSTPQLFIYFFFLAILLIYFSGHLSKSCTHHAHLLSVSIHTTFITGVSNLTTSRASYSFWQQFHSYMCF